MKIDTIHGFWGEPKISLVRSLKLFGVVLITLALAVFIDVIAPGECIDLKEQENGADSKCTSVWGTTYYEHVGDGKTVRISVDDSTLNIIFFIFVSGASVLSLIFFGIGILGIITMQHEKSISYLKDQEEERKRKKIEAKEIKAKEREEARDYDSAILIWEELGKIKEAARVRKKQAEQGSVKVTQKVVHGDEVTRTEIKDSVLNRSSVGSGKSKAENLREAKSLFEEGLIDDAEFKQMKKEILGK